MLILKKLCSAEIVPCLSWRNNEMQKIVSYHKYCYSDSIYYWNYLLTLILTVKKIEAILWHMQENLAPFWWWKLGKNILSLVRIHLLPLYLSFFIWFYLNDCCWIRYAVMVVMYGCMLSATKFLASYLRYTFCTTNGVSPSSLSHIPTHI